MKDCNEQVTSFERAEVRMSEDDRADIYGKAKTNRNRLKSGLERNDSPKAIGSRTQGSYAMRTMIQNDRGDYDVDDGVYFKRDRLKNENGEDKSAPDARKMVSDALQDDRFADQPEPRDNCVRVYYKKEGYHVDVPVYRENRIKDPFTGEEKKSYEIAAGEKWRTSDPLANTKWFKDENKNRSPDATANGNDGQFVRIVRLVKAFARSRSGWSSKISSGFAISKLVSDHFVQSDGRDDYAFRQTMKNISARLAWNDAIRHPVLNENIAGSGERRRNSSRRRSTRT
ncbi:nucleotidyltransferase [Bradyrhizobium sp. CB3481]|uniref:nucleotidyltransferase domain-containing protein n=1 Tax=Bradyrhizobium sp. CB3481 TaxID=3039158 RepID=UPI0024B11268|nr:nucleotidyltransferase [Bradyrhizobium sp. CB3481]WFU14847.1 nucleotidyltransferase [Bradyrhizobium sp. CB3481]